MKKFLLNVLMLVFGFVTIGNAAEKWITDYDKALEESSDRNIPILALFTGSDWCPYCMDLEKDVLSQEEFIDFASKSFVLLYLDFPQNKKIDPKLEKQNEKLSEQYSVEGFPTILILDKKGKVIDECGYGTLEEIIDLLKEALKKSN